MKQTLFLAVFACLVLTGVYTLITLYDANLNVGRMNQTPVVRPHEEPILVIDKKAVAYHQSEALIREKLPQGMLPGPDGLSDEILAMGKADYQAFCSPCHGPDMDGLGTVGQSFSPLPTNLLDEKAVQLTDLQLFTVISYGTKKSPALASSMSIESRKAVIRFIRYKQETGL